MGFGGIELNKFPKDNEDQIITRPFEEWGKDGGDYAGALAGMTLIIAIVVVLISAALP